MLWQKQFWGNYQLHVWLSHSHVAFRAQLFHIVSARVTETVSKLTVDMGVYRDGHPGSNILNETTPARPNSLKMHKKYAKNNG